MSREQSLESSSLSLLTLGRQKNESRTTLSIQPSGEHSGYRPAITTPEIVITARRKGDRDALEEVMQSRAHPMTGPQIALLLSMQFKDDNSRMESRI